jgi:hypothetical protein
MKFGMHTEDWGFYSATIAAVKRGEPLEQAVKTARKYVVDYNLLNSPADKAMQGIFGFYTWSRRNFPNQIATLFNDPKQYAMMVKVMDRISNREKLSNDEIDALNGYEKESFKVFGDVVDGVRTFASLGFLPAEEAYQTYNALMSGEVGKFFSERATPVALGFLDYVYGENSFYGTETGNYLAAKFEKIIPKSLQKALGLTPREKPVYKGGNIVGKETVLYGSPDAVFMIRQFPITSRFVNDLATLVDSWSKGDVGKGLLRYTTGIKPKELNVESRKRWKARRVKEAQIEKAKERGGRSFERFYAPKGHRKTKSLIDTIRARLP